MKKDTGSYAFISYSSKNQQDAYLIRTILQQNGIKCWMAPDDIPGGSKYAHVINDALEACGCLVLALTQEAQNSQFVEREVERAVSYGKPIIPLQLSDLELNSGFKFYIGSSHIIPIPEIRDGAPEMKKAIESVRPYVGVAEESVEIREMKAVEISKAQEKSKASGTANVSGTANASETPKVSETPEPPMPKSTVLPQVDITNAIARKELKVFKKCDNHEKTNIAVVGIGGTGNNAINKAVENGYVAIKLIAVNSDKEGLEKCKCGNKLLIGERLCRGLGAGARPELGRNAALENIPEIMQLLEGIDVLFLRCGLGGGTGTGATPVIAQIARRLGILTIALVSWPFQFEAKARIDTAREGLKELEKHVDTVILMPNDAILGVVDKSATMPEAMRKIEVVCWDAMYRLAEQIVISDENFLESFCSRGIARIGIGIGQGGSLDATGKLLEALTNATNSPWLGQDMNTIRDALILLSGDVSAHSKMFTVEHKDEWVGAIPAEAVTSENVFLAANAEENTVMAFIIGYESIRQSKISAAAGTNYFLTNIKDLSVIKLTPGTVMIGRDTWKCDIIIEDTKVSRIHGVLTVSEKGVLFYRDLNTINGSFVNGERVTEVKLAVNDIIKFGDTEYILDAEW